MKKLASAATAILLGVIMALSCLVTVSAATDTSIVDPNQKGSLTLTKYDSSTVQKDGNGNITSGTPVKGARFSLYKILAYDGTNGYTLTDFTKAAINKYNETATTPIDLDKVVDSIVISNSEVPGGDGYATYGKTTYLESLMYIFQTYINSATLTNIPSLTTDDNGTGTANDLDLGVYFVNESLVPGGYIATTNSFLVSIPFWNKDKEEDNKWEYAVTAYPKDQPYENTVDKQIVDTEANTTKDTDSLSVGDTVSYQVSGKVPNYGKSVQNISKNLTEDRTIVTQEVYDKLPFVLTDELSAGLTYKGGLVVKVGAESAELKQDTGATLSDDKKTVTWSTDASTKGDYFVNFDKGTNTLTVIVKWDSINTYQGTPIVFTYDAVVDADAVVTDGNGNTAKISVANNPSTFNGDYSKITTKEYTSSVDTSTVYTYQFDLTKTFDGKKVSDFADGSKPNASNVKFEICKNDTGKTPLQFFKTSDGTYTLWTGDYYTDTDSKIYAVVDVIAADGTKPTELGTAYTDVTKYVLDGNVKAFANETNKAKSELVTQIAVGSTGTLNIKGLENETYFLNEVSTADGYSVLSKPIEIVVTDVTANVTIDTYYPFWATTEDDFDKTNKEYYTKTGDTYTNITDFSDKLNMVVYLKDSKTISGTATSDVEATVKNGESLTTQEGYRDNGKFAITVNNAKSQFNLPITGGLGLWMFTIGGGVVMAGAIIFFSVIRKKKSKKV